jgi:iron complex outermembrane receptor protein
MREAGAGLAPARTRPRRFLPLRFLSTALILLAAGSARESFCEDPVPDLTAIGIEAVMDMEVTSVSKKPEKLLVASAAVFVITSDEIRRSGATRIPEILRLVPGVQVARIDANKWAVGVRGFASRLSRSLLVLIDGRSVYSPLFAGVYWEVQDTLLEDVDRIEVIRGPGATLWGVNAVNGVINIITKNARDTQGALAKVGGGNENRLQTALRYGGHTSRGVTYRTYGKFFDRDGGFHQVTDDFDGWHMAQGGFRADVDQGDRDHFTLQGDLYDGKSGQRSVVTTYTAPYVQTVEEDADLSGASLLGQWTRRIHEGSETTLQFYYDRTDRSEPTFGESRDTFDLEFRHQLSAGSRHDLLWGAGYRLTSGATEGVPTVQFIPAERTDDVLSAFVQDDIRLAASKCTLTLGSKFEYNDYSGFEYQPNARVLFRPAARHTIWSAVSRAVRVPSRIEQDLSLTAFMEPTTPTFFRLQGNKAFVPERLMAYEIGYRLQATERLFLDLAAFYNDYAKLLSLEPGTPFTETSPSPSHSVVPLLLDNKLGGTTHGAEVAYEWRPVADWRLSGSYSYLQMDLERAPDSLDASSVQSLEGSSPRHMADLHSALDLPRNVRLDLILRYMGRLPSQGIEDYTEMDLSVGWRFSPSLEFSLAGRNLLSAHHPEFGGGSGGITEVERTVFGKIVRRW